VVDLAPMGRTVGSEVATIKPLGHNGGLRDGRMFTLFAARAANAWLPFLDTYRTMCCAPHPAFRQILAIQPSVMPRNSAHNKLTGFNARIPGRSARQRNPISHADCNTPAVAPGVRERLARYCVQLSTGGSAMADDPINRGQPDRSKINMSEDYEIRYWIKHLNVTAEELRRVIEKVGNSAAAVRKELGQAG